ncbi:YhcN/YlaJ family sporulation lipoprotein [Syntrophomonas erecta subsp. sporosyntropha]
MRKKIALLLCLVFLNLIIFSGCQSAAKKPVTPEQKPRVTRSADGDLTASERRVLATRLSNLAQNVQGVQKATVVVSSIAMTNNGKTTRNTINNPNTAINNNTNLNRDTAVNYSGLVIMVGLTLTPNMMKNANDVNEIKRTVANKLKASDKRISQVLVTTDPNLIVRINDVAVGIIQGRPVQSYQDDVNNLINRLKQQQPAF